MADLRLIWNTTPRWAVIAIFLAAAVGSGCAQQMQKTSAAQTEYNVDDTACRMQAYQEAPDKPVQFDNVGRIIPTAGTTAMERQTAWKDCMYNEAIDSLTPSRPSARWLADNLLIPACAWGGTRRLPDRPSPVWIAGDVGKQTVEWPRLSAFSDGECDHPPTEAGARGRPRPSEVSSRFDPQGTFKYQSREVRT